MQIQYGDGKSNPNSARTTVVPIWRLLYPEEPAVAWDKVTFVPFPQVKGCCFSVVLESRASVESRTGRFYTEILDLVTPSLFLLYHGRTLAQKQKQQSASWY